MRSRFLCFRSAVMLRDTPGCLYEVRPCSALDARSRAEPERVI